MKIRTFNKLGTALLGLLLVANGIALHILYAKNNKPAEERSYYNEVVTHEIITQFE